MESRAGVNSFYKMFNKYCFEIDRKRVIVMPEIDIVVTNVPA